MEGRDQGYEVYGIIRHISTFNTDRIDHIYIYRRLSQRKLPYLPPLALPVVAKLYAPYSKSPKQLRITRNESTYAKP